MQKRFVISLGGSLLYPGTIDVGFLKAFKTLVERRVKRGESFVIVVGGGKLCREYQHALKKITRPTSNDLDWIGIHTTRLNAQLVRILFGTLAHGEVVTAVGKSIRNKKPIIIAAGTKPGQSTDGVAVKLAKLTEAEVVINVSNIDYLFDKDPRSFNSAKKIKQISWKEYRKLVGSTRVPGGNYPFDPIAAKFAQAHGQKVIIVNGRNIKNLEQVIMGKKFLGTTIG